MPALRVALIGPHCAGKTTLCRLLARRLGLHCHEVDERVALRCAGVGDPVGREECFLRELSASMPLGGVVDNHPVSVYAYAMALAGDAEASVASRLVSLANRALSYASPLDVFVALLAPAELLLPRCYARGRRGTIHIDTDAAFTSRVVEWFRALVYRLRRLGSTVIVLDAGRGPAEVMADAVRALPSL